MRVLTLMLFALLSTPFLRAADVSGKWTGTLEFKSPEGEAQSVPAHAEFKQEGSSITGKVWKEAEHPFVIEQGKAEGAAISFVFSAPEGEEEDGVVHSVKLGRVGQTQLQGTLEFEAGGQKTSGKISLTREK